MEWGGNLEHLIDLQDRGVQVDAIQSRPVLLDGLDFYFSAYSDLETDRQISMGGVGAVPWNSIIKWCNFHGVHDIYEIEILTRYIRSMEKAEYQFRDKKAKGKAK